MPLDGFIRASISIGISIKDSWNGSEKLDNDELDEEWDEFELYVRLLEVLPQEDNNMLDCPHIEYIRTFFHIF